MNEPGQIALQTVIKWGVIYTIVGIIFGLLFFPDVVYGLSVHTARSKAVLGGVIGFGGTVFSIAIKYLLGDYHMESKR